MKKKLLLLTGSFYGNENAMFNAIKNLLPTLKELYEVDVFVQFNNHDLPLYEERNGFRIFRSCKLDHDNNKTFKYNLLHTLELDERTISFRRNVLIYKAIRILAKNCPFLLKDREKWSNSFDDLISKKHYDVIFSISSPIKNQSDCLKARKENRLQGTKWIAYYLDPFATFISNTKKGRFNVMMDFEEDVYKNADLVVVSPELKSDNRNNQLNKYADKVKELQICNLNVEDNDVEPYIYPDSGYNIYYGGSFFDKEIRDPSYFFKLISKLPDNINVYIACVKIDKRLIRLKKQYLDGKKNIHWSGSLPLYESMKMMKGADALINVSNETTNQFPSKVFDYISMCKPIINFYSKEEDLSKKYLELYPSSINIKNKNGVSEKDINDLTRFLEENKNHSISKMDFIENYKKFSKENAIKAFKNILESTL